MAGWGPPGPAGGTRLPRPPVPPHRARLPLAGPSPATWYSTVVLPRIRVEILGARSMAQLTDSRAGAELKLPPAEPHRARTWGGAEPLLTSPPPARGYAPGSWGPAE